MKHNVGPVQKMNDLIRSELGLSPTGLPLYAWRFLPDIHFPLAKWENGEPVYDMRQSESGLYVRTRIIRNVPVYAWHHPDQWAICQWESPVTVEEWARVYGTLENYMEKGSYVFNGPTMTPLHKSGIAPSWRTTRQFIAEVKRQKAKRAAQIVQEEQDAVDKFVAAGMAQARDYASNLWPAFDNPYSGKRGGHVSAQTGVGESPHLKKEEAHVN